MKKNLLKTWLFSAVILMVGNVSAQIRCENNILSGSNFSLAASSYFAPNWAASSNYTATWSNGTFTVHLGDATNQQWQAQMKFDCSPVAVVTGKTYFISFDITSNNAFNGVTTQVLNAAADDAAPGAGAGISIDLGLSAVTAGTQTISGTFTTTAKFTEVSRILFDFGNNPANTDITISNFVLCDQYSEGTTTDNNNLIKGGDMESATPWIQVGGTDAGTNSQLVWGDVPNDARPQSYKPEGFGTGGFFTFSVNWGVQQYFMAQQVPVTAGTTYTASFDYNLGDYSRAWLEVYMGKTDPTTVTDYLDGKVGQGAIPWGEYIPGTGDGKFSADTTFTESGTLYFVIKMGCGWSGGGGEGYLNLSLDNVSLVANSGTAIKNVDLNENKAFVVGGKSSITAIFNGTEKVIVYSIQGQIIKETTAQNKYEADGLPSGIYLVKIGNKTYKVIVQ